MQAEAPSVLTVEEDPAEGAHLRLALEDAGFAVVAEAGDDAEAVELAREHRPDIVVLRTRSETSDRIVEDRSIPLVEVPRPFSAARMIEAVTGALVEHREREIRDSRNASLRSIETLVEHLSFATPSPSELEQASWARGHVWRRVDPPKDEAS